MKAGLNLWSLQKFIKTEEDFLDTALKLKDMGYDFLQFSGAPYDPELIKRVVDASGMPVVLTHAPLDKILQEPEKLTEEHLSFGCQNIGLGTIKKANMADDDTWKKTIDELNLCAEKIKKAGGKFFFHNHHYEMFRFKNGQRVIDYMIENAPNFNFTLDSYWLQVAGCDPLAIADKVKGRMECVHLKDCKVYRKIDEQGNIEFKAHYAPLGEGSMDFKKIIKKWTDCGAKYFLVEQDDAYAYPEPFEQVKISIEYLKKI